MSETKSGASSGYNHGPGSFAHNNSDRLPGQSPPNLNAPDVRSNFSQTRDAATQAQYADLGKTEAERRAAFSQPQMSRSAFMAHRRPHQPMPELTMNAPLPYRQQIDWAKHTELQRQEHETALRDQSGAPQAKPMSKDQFLAQRFGDAAHGHTQAQGKSR